MFDVGSALECTNC